MGPLARSKATLRIFGDELVPEEISRLLGAEPTSAHAKGPVLSKTSGRVVMRHSASWRLEAIETAPECLDDQVSDLLGQLTQDLSVWSDIASRFRVDLFCGWLMSSSNEGVEVSPETMLALGRRHIQLSIDIYEQDAPRDRQALPQA